MWRSSQRYSLSVSSDDRQMICHMYLSFAEVTCSRLRGTNTADYCQQKHTCCCHVFESQQEAMCLMLEELVAKSFLSTSQTWRLFSPGAQACYLSQVKGKEEASGASHMGTAWASSAGSSVLETVLLTCASKAILVACTSVQLSADHMVSKSLTSS